MGTQYLKIKSLLQQAWGIVQVEAVATEWCCRIWVSTQRFGCNFSYEVLKRCSVQ